MKLLTALVVACGFLPNLSLAQPAMAEAVKIGAMLNLTGEMAEIGDKTLKGMRLAQREFEAKDVELVVEDSGGAGAGDTELLQHDALQRGANL